MSGGPLERLRAGVAHRLAPSAGGPEPLPLSLLELERDGPAPLASKPPAEGPLRIAAVIPPFRRGSGGHRTIVNLLRALAGRGHSVSLWLEDHAGTHGSVPAAQTAAEFAEYFAAPELALQVGFGDWDGADVVLATGWQTVARVLLLRGAGGRAYLVQDHEPDFYPASVESLWAASSYRRGLHCLAASPWLAALLRERYRATATHFDLAVEHAVYRPREAERESELVAFYARSSTPRRAVPLGLLALAELARRRPQVRIELYGGTTGLQLPFRHEDRGVLADRELAELYSRASAGMVLSMTNPSLVCLEMMACGLPCVELASESMLASFGQDSPLSLAAADPLALARALDDLLGDPELREQARARGLELMATRTWAAAAEQVEAGLREALGESARR